MNKDEVVNNIKRNFDILRMFGVSDLLEALLLNDIEELERMRDFYNAQKFKMEDVKYTIENSSDEEVKDIVGKFKKDQFNKDRGSKEYLIKEGVVKKVIHKIKRRGKK